MSYKILYDPELTHKFPNPKDRRSMLGLSAIIIATVLSIACMISKHKNEVKLFNNLEVTITAFSEIVDDLKAGETMIEALSDCCVKIIKNETDI